MKKIIAGLVAAACVSSVAFADITLSFYNKLYEEDYIVEHIDVDKGNGERESETNTDFPALNERMYVELNSDRVDAMIKATFALNDYDDRHFGLQGKVNDWFIAFRPIDELTLGLHTGIHPEGDYLPIYDDNLGAGNIGSDGFTVSFAPAALDNALRVAVTIPFSFDGSKNRGDINWLNGTEEMNEDEEFDVGIGAIFGQELFQVGVSIQDIIDSDERQLGAYASFPTLFGVSEDLTLGVGFAHSWAEGREAFADLISVGTLLSAGVAYENLLNASLTFKQDAYSLSAELLYNFGEDYGWSDDGPVPYDFYTAVSATYGLADNIDLTVTGKILMDTSSNNFKNLTYGAVGIDYGINDNNTVGAEFDIAFHDSQWAIAVPLYWKYSFKQ